jgi:hypothetical protein
LLFFFLFSAFPFTFLLLCHLTFNQILPRKLSNYAILYLHICQTPHQKAGPFISGDAVSSLQNRPRIQPRQSALPLRKLYLAFIYNRRNSRLRPICTIIQIYSHLA